MGGGSRIGICKYECMIAVSIMGKNNDVKDILLRFSLIFAVTID